MSTNPAKVHLKQVFKPKHFKPDEPLYHLEDPLYEVKVDWAKLKEVYAPVKLDPEWVKQQLDTAAKDYAIAVEDKPYDCDSSRCS